MDKTPIISMRGVSYSYSGSVRPALDSIDRDIQAGEWVSIVGANGSGKSTLAKICNALLIPTQGDCFVRALNTAVPADAQEVRRSVALVFQNPDDQIVASIVEEDVAFGPENLMLAPAEIRERVDRALAVVGLTEKRRRGSYLLSGGQKQRLALAGALAMRPAVLVLDESTAMLDPEGREEFVATLLSLKETGMTIIQITHRMEEALASDRIVVIDRGSVVWDGLPADFFGGEYLAWNFDEPSEFELNRTLAAQGLIPAETLPAVDAMLDALSAAL